MPQHADFPLWTTAVSVLLLAIAIGSAAWVLMDVLRRPQMMKVMNVVWPLTMLFGSVPWLIFYLRQGRAPERGAPMVMGKHSMPVSVAISTSHCGAGCSAADLVGELLFALIPGFAVVFGLGWLFDDPMFAAWVLDFILAYAAGILFQYYSMRSMSDAPWRSILWRAVKADTLSITFWQLGMYGLMALAQLVVLPLVFGGRAAPGSPQFWVVMQLAMVVGFATAYPVNWWLLKVGVKERM
jgi:hypothetical protein